MAARSLAGRVIRPIEHIARASQALGDGEFEVRTTPSGIPELDRAGAALNQTAKRLQDLIRRERNLAANASHQLRTPLTGLRMVLEGALTAPNADLRGILAQAIERTDQLDLTIDQLIVLGRGGTEGESAMQRHISTQRIAAGAACWPLEVDHFESRCEPAFPM